jgi:hypothetical protein
VGFVLLKSNMTGVISGAGSTYFSEHSSSSLFLSGVCVAQE